VTLDIQQEAKGSFADLQSGELAGDLAIQEGLSIGPNDSEMVCPIAYDQTDSARQCFLLLLQGVEARHGFDALGE
jgi:hypothetical protein